jgi:hypothetical protein
MRCFENYRKPGSFLIFETTTNKCSWSVLKITGIPKVSWFPKQKLKKYFENHNSFVTLWSGQLLATTSIFLGVMLFPVSIVTVVVSTVPRGSFAP